jgi:hypothetical protein
MKMKRVSRAKRLVVIAFACALVSTGVVAFGPSSGQEAQAACSIVSKWTQVPNNTVVHDRAYTIQIRAWCGGNPKADVVIYASDRKGSQTTYTPPARYTSAIGYAQFPMVAKAPTGVHTVSVSYGDSTKSYTVT